MLHVFGYIAAIFVGLSLGLLGGGGAILTVPILVYLFAIDPLKATGYSLFVVGTTSVIGVVNHIRHQNVNFRAALIFGLPSIASVYLTRLFVVHNIPEIVFDYHNIVVTKSTFLLVLFAILMVLASYSMIRNQQYNVSHKPNTWVLGLEGFGVGFITSLVGSGGGFLIIPALVFFAGLPMKKAVGTSLAVIAVNCFIGFLGDLSANQIFDWKFLMAFTLLSILGIIIGSTLHKRVSNEQLKPAFGWFILAMGIYIIIREIYFRN